MRASCVSVVTFASLILRKRCVSSSTTALSRIVSADSFDAAVWRLKKVDGSATGGETGFVGDDFPVSERLNLNESDACVGTGGGGANAPPPCGRIGIAILGVEVVIVRSEKLLGPLNPFSIRRRLIESKQKHTHTTIHTIHKGGYLCQPDAYSACSQLLWSAGPRSFVQCFHLFSLQLLKRFMPFIPWFADLVQLCVGGCRVLFVAHNHLPMFLVFSVIFLCLFKQRALYYLPPCCLLCFFLRGFLLRLLVRLPISQPAPLELLVNRQGRAWSFRADRPALRKFLCNQLL